jgi:hypothetical protein
LAELRIDQKVVGERMCRERDEAPQLQYQATFDEVVLAIKGAENRLASLRREVTAPSRAPEVEAEEAVCHLSQLMQVLDQPAARIEFKETFKKLDGWVGLEFCDGAKGKGAVRRLRGGLVTFGEQSLPTPIHRADRLPNDPAGAEPDMDQPSEISSSQPASTEEATKGKQKRSIVLSTEKL